MFEFKECGGILEMDTRVLFKPGKIGKLEIRNRLVMAPMATNFATIDGQVTSELIDYYVERAKGGVGLIIVEVTRAETKMQSASITGANLQLDTHSHIIGMSQLTDAVHEYGAKIFLQLTLGQGSYAPPELYPKGALPNAVSEAFPPSHPDQAVHVLTAQEIEQLIEAFAEAAQRAKLAGFDGIDTNGHGMYLLSQFMSPYTNKRTDKYGDPTAVPLELIKAVRDKVGGDFPFSFRFNIDEFLEGGRTLEQSKVEAKLFEEAGIDVILMSGGNFWVTGGACHSTPPMSYPQGYLRPLAKAMKEAVNIPLIITGKILDPLIAAEILDSGEADFIGLARALIADPDWPNKVAEGRLEDIKPCIADMDGCLERMANFKKVRCSVNARTGREREYKIEPAAKPKKVLVIGGGPGGMEAARVAALRGHDVTLYEKGDRLGGRMILAGMIPHKDDINRLTRYLTTQVNKLGVKVFLGKEATPELVEASQPEAVIVATGARPLIPKITGINGPNVFIADDIIQEKAEVAGENIAVAGGGFVGLDTAMFLAEKKKKKVTVVEQFTFEEVGITPYSMNYMDWFTRLDKLGVKLMPETKIEGITSQSVLATDKKGKKSTIKADSVVLAMGGTPNKELVEALKERSLKVYAVGDCLEAGKIINAIAGGFRTAFNL
jgi:2,4-dienoyl-CoA reductase-like NADH-dependent reductase (Old Yellow Enzyme family)/thioredoxin reductase